MNLLPLLLKRAAARRRLECRVQAKCYIAERGVRPDAAKVHLETAIWLRNEARKFETQAKFIERGQVR